MKAAPFLKKFTPVAGIFIVLMTIWSILSEIWISFPPWPSGLFAWFAAFLLVSQLSKSQTLQIGILLTDRYRVKTSRPKRHAATYASRAGTPIEIVSKVILRHADLSTTQRYLGKVNDTEAIRRIETICG